MKESNPSALKFQSPFWRREASVMQLVQDPLIVKFYGANPGDDANGVMPFMVMEKPEKGDLWKFINSFPGVIFYSFF